MTDTENAIIHIDATGLPDGYLYLLEPITEAEYEALMALRIRAVQDAVGRGELQVSEVVRKGSPTALSQSDFTLVK
jgi:hypothetical protein